MTPILLDPAGELPAGSGGASGFFVPVSCPACGSGLDVRASGVPSTSESSAVLSCPSCRLELQLLVRLLPVPKPASARRARIREKASA